MALNESRWRQVEGREREADGTFVFAVVTTGIYCRPSCPSRRPKRQNVRFYAIAREAAAAGYRPCKRCRPDAPAPWQRAARAVEAACRRLEADGVALAELAAEAGYSAHHFHRVFKAHTGLTPRGYAEAARARRTETAMAAAESVADGAYAGGYASLSRFYDAAAERAAIAPASLRRGGAGEVLVTATAASSLGAVAAAFSRRGIVAVRLADTPLQALNEVVATFPNAMLIDGGVDFAALMRNVVATIDEPTAAEELPLDIRGTAFEERVWAALRAIPIGTTMSYGELAAAIGAPSAHRAVARACGANRIAVLVPCHRVVRADGSLAGYRWGVRRKAALIERERDAAEAAVG